MPLGACALATDELPLRAALRFVLGKIAGLPHLVPTPRGKGGMVLNLHVCAGRYIAPLRAMLEAGFFRPGLRLSIHYAAGPDCDAPGDGLGFDALNPRKGLPLVRALLPYGAVGSHGGWAHNFFARRLSERPEPWAQEYLESNFESLALASGSPVLEYSAPGGNHPRWVTRWLSERGATAYYFSGADSSSPTQLEEGEPWAFPVSCLGRSACPEEARSAGFSDSEIESWYDDLIRFVESERVVRLVYAHPTENGTDLGILLGLSRRLAEEAGAGRLIVWPMSEFARFFRRRQETEWEVRALGEETVITLENQGGLDGICVAVRTRGTERWSADGAAVDVERDGSWTFFTVNGSYRNATIRLMRAPARTSPWFRLPGGRSRGGTLRELQRKPRPGPKRKNPGG